MNPLPRLSPGGADIFSPAPCAANLYGCVFGVPAAIFILGLALQPPGLSCAVPTNSHSHDLSPPHLAQPRRIADLIQSSPLRNITRTLTSYPYPSRLLRSSFTSASGGRLSTDTVRVAVRDFHHGMLSVVEAWVIAVVFKTWLNVGVGRLRPDFYASGGPNQDTHSPTEGKDARASYPRCVSVGSRASAATVPPSHACAFETGSALVYWRCRSPVESQRARGLLLQHRRCALLVDDGSMGSGAQAPAAVRARTQSRGPGSCAGTPFTHELSRTASHDCRWATGIRRMGRALGTR